MNTTTEITETKPTETKSQLYLYLISQTVNGDWDTFDSAVVCAESEEEARRTHPGVNDSEEYWSRRATVYKKAKETNNIWRMYDNWTNFPEEVCVQYLGVAAPHITKGVICSSYNAG